MKKNTANFTESEAIKIKNGVLEFLQEIDENYCPSKDMVLTLKDGYGNLYGGAVGFYFLGCLNVDWIWVNKEYRGQGEGKKILGMIDEFALQNNNRFIILFCYGGGMLDFYKQHGYYIEFSRVSYDHNIIKYYLRKDMN